MHRSNAISVQVVADDESVISHAGALLVQGMCDKVGLTSGIGELFPRSAGKLDRGCVIRDLAVAIADGADSVVAVEMLRAQRAAFGPVASDTTAWRTLGEFSEQRRAGFRGMLAAARARVWNDPRVWIPRLLAIDVDATLVTCHTDKELASGNYKRGFGFHPIVCSLDATGEPLAVLLRPGNAGANCASDLLDALHQGLAQLPARAFDTTLHDIVVRMDSAGHSHEVVDHLQSHGLGFVIGADLTTEVWQKIGKLDESAWIPAIDQDGFERDYAHVAELAAPEKWGEGVRLIARRERAHIGAPMKLLDLDGNRYQILITNLKSHDLAFICALYNGRGRAEQVIDEIKRCGLGKLPGKRYDDNQAWICVSLLAANLARWTQMLILDRPWQTARIDTIRNYLLHTGARLTRHARRITLHLNKHWPAAQAIARAFDRLRKMHTPTLQPI